MPALPPGEIAVNPPLLAFALALLAVGMLVFAEGLWRRARLRDRNDAVVTAVLAHAEGRPALPAGQAKGWAGWLEAFGRLFENHRLEAWLLAPEDRLLLDQCGCDSARGRAVFLASRLLLAASLPTIAMAVLRPHGIGVTTTIVTAFGIGVLLPKFLLRAWAARLVRQATVELPLLIDLLRMLQGVGLSMDQSLHTVAEQFRAGMPVLGRELQVANELYARGRDREQSLHRLADLFGSEDLRGLARLIAQVDRHGGAVQEPLRLFGERLREQRKLRMKEAVGRLSVKMTIVMMLTLLPALMLVLAGPAIIALAGAMSKLGGY
jgi:tight adherence protein C